MIAKNMLFFAGEDPDGMVMAVITVGVGYYQSILPRPYEFLLCACLLARVDSVDKMADSS